MISDPIRRRVTSSLARRLTRRPLGPSSFSETPFNGPLSGTTQVSRSHKGKTNLDFTWARDSEWLWYQLGHMQVCTLLHTDNHASTSLLSFFTGRMPFLPPNQQYQSTEGAVYLTALQSYIDNLSAEFANYNKCKWLLENCSVHKCVLLEVWNTMACCILTVVPSLYRNTMLTVQSVW